MTSSRDRSWLPSVGHLHLTASPTGATITVIDSALTTVATGPDHVNLIVPAGVYRLRTEAADASDWRFVTVQPGQTEQRHIRLQFRRRPGHQKLDLPGGCRAGRLRGKRTPRHRNRP